MAEIPQDLIEALGKAGLAQFFVECTSAHQREYLQWINEAKRPETRKVRIEKTVTMLSKKKAEEETTAKRRI